MIDKLYNSLRESLLYSFKKEMDDYNRFVTLCEERSVPVITERMAEEISDYCCRYVDNKTNMPTKTHHNNRLREYDITIPEDLCHNISGVFVYSLDVKINLFVCDNEKLYYHWYKGQDSGSYDSFTHDDKLSHYNGFNYPMMDKVTIELKCFVDEITKYSSIYYSILHELNHAYEDYKRLLKGKETYNQWLGKTGYLSIDKIMKNTNKQYESYLTNILYNLSKTESNAKVAQIYGELKGKHFISSIFAADAIKNTSAYKTLKNAYNYLEELKNINDNDIKTDILKLYNSITKQTIKQYNELMQTLQDDLDYVSKYIFIKASRTIQDINRNTEISKTQY